MSFRQHILARTVHRLVLLLLLGAAINIAIAWGLNFWRVDETRSTSWYCWLALPGEQALKGIVAEHAGLRMTYWSSEPFPPPSSAPSVPAWSRLADIMRDQALDTHTLNGYTWLEVAAGWPMPSMRWCMQGAPEENLAYAAIRLPDAPGFAAWNWQRVRVLPVDPIPLGFAANTALNATFLGLLILTPLRIRSWLRSRRNLCRMCAYPIGTSPVCTECGVAVQGAP